MNEACRDARTMVISKKATGLLLSFLLCVSACSAPAANSGQKLSEGENTKVNMDNISSGQDLQGEYDANLTAKVSVTKTSIVIEYHFSNQSNSDIYILDAQPGVKPNSQTPYVELNEFYMCFKEPHTAIMLRGILPLPVSPVSRRVMPLATRLKPKEELDRTLTLELPLRERNDWYDPPLEPDQYVKDTVNKIMLNVQFLRSTVEEFHAEPSDFAPQFFNVSSKNTVGDVETRRVELHIGPTEMLKRTDLFVRIG
jgi:hypothetical protein